MFMVTLDTINGLIKCLNKAECLINMIFLRAVNFFALLKSKIHSFRCLAIIGLCNIHALCPETSENGLDLINYFSLRNMNVSYTWVGRGKILFECADTAVFPFTLTCL